MLKQKYFLTDFFILSAEKQPIKSSWRKIEWLLSKASNERIHIYNDSESVDNIALVKDCLEIKQIVDARIYDNSSRVRTPKIGQIVILQNINGFYSALKILVIKDDTRGDQNDEVSFEYVIQTNGTPFFS